MAIEVIPAGSSVVVTDKDHASASERVKDTLAVMSATDGVHFSDTLRTVKDAEAQLDRASGDRFMQLVKDVKDAEARLDRSAGDRFIDTIQDVKDAETRLDRAAGDRFIDTIQDIKAVEMATLRARGEVVAAIKESEFVAEKSAGHTREMMSKGFSHVLEEQAEAIGDVKDTVLDTYRGLEKVAYQNQMQTLLQFKDQALLSEKLAAHQELLSEKLAAKAAAKAAECCCEIKELIRSDGDETRELINSLETDRLRDRAAKAEGQLAAYFARGVAPVVP